MNIDTLKVGDIVHFRSGGTAKVSHVGKKHASYYFKFEGYNEPRWMSFFHNGSYSGNDVSHLLDIVDVTPLVEASHVRIYIESCTGGITANYHKMYEWSAYELEQLAESIKMDIRNELTNKVL